MGIHMNMLWEPNFMMLPTSTACSGKAICNMPTTLQDSSMIRTISRKRSIYLFSLKEKKNSARNAANRAKNALSESWVMAVIKPITR